jgi:hypothetical protein
MKYEKEALIHRHLQSAIAAVYKGLAGSPSCIMQRSTDG